MSTVTHRRRKKFSAVFGLIFRGWIQEFREMTDFKATYYQMIVRIIRFKQNSRGV